MKTELSCIAAAKSVSEKLQAMVSIVKGKRRRPAGRLQFEGIWPNFDGQLVPGKIDYVLKINPECTALMYGPLKANNLQNQETKRHCVDVTLYGVSRTHQRRSERSMISKGARRATRIISAQPNIRRAKRRS